MANLMLYKRARKTLEPRWSPSQPILASLGVEWCQVRSLFCKQTEQKLKCDRPVTSTMHTCCYRKTCEGALFSSDAERIIGNLKKCNVSATLPNVSVVYGETWGGGGGREKRGNLGPEPTAIETTGKTLIFSQSNTQENVRTGSST